MSVDSNLHIGPYMVVKGEKTEMLDREVRTCSDKKCQTHKSNQKYSESQKFCAECGAKIELKKYKEKWMATPNNTITDEPYDIEFCDELCYAMSIKKGEDVFVPNEINPFEKTRGSLDECNEDYLDLTDVEMEAEMKWFKKRYERIIDVFKKEFGAECYIIKWGVINWYS